LRIGRNGQPTDAGHATLLRTSGERPSRGAGANRRDEPAAPQLVIMATPRVINDPGQVQIFMK
jgi:hypothetical protein